MNEKESSMIFPEMEQSWAELLKDELTATYFSELKKTVIVEKGSIEIYPALPKIFTAFELTHIENLKVVILGQDPYHAPGQANGLAFSVPPGVKTPPSLRNIFKELHDDVGMSIPDNGDLTNWAKQGVLLLNTTLTVRESSPGSHQNIGWETFSDEVIRITSRIKDHVVFILWGNFARSKRSLIDEKKHLVLESVHPSPLSAHRGFVGCRHFSKTNEFLVENGLEPIDWTLPSSASIQSRLDFDSQV